MDYKKHLSHWLTVIWLVVLCAASYFIFQALPVDHFKWENIDYSRAGLGIVVGLVGSLPLVWVVHNYLVKESWLVSFILTFLPAVAKYIPGKIWSFLGFVLQAKNMANIPEKDASFFQIYSQLIGILASVILTITSITVINFIRNTNLLLYFNMGAIVLLFASIVIIYFFLNIARHYNHTVNQSKIAFHTVAMSVQKVIKGLALVLFLSAFIPIHDFTFEIVLASVIAVQVGLFAFFAPAGLGVTESAYILLLSEPLSLATAVQIAILARIWQVILDIVLAVISFVLKLCYF